MKNAEHSALMDRLVEAQKVVDLAEQEGVFNDCYYTYYTSERWTRRSARRTKLRLHQRMVELLAGQYPDLKWDLVIRARRTIGMVYHAQMRVRYPHERKQGFPVQARLERARERS